MKQFQSILFQNAEDAYNYVISARQKGHNCFCRENAVYFTDSPFV